MKDDYTKDDEPIFSEETLGNLILIENELITPGENGELDDAWMNKLNKGIKRLNETLSSSDLKEEAGNHIKNINAAFDDFKKSFSKIRDQIDEHNSKEDK